MADTIPPRPTPGLLGPNGWRTLCSHTTMERVFHTEDGVARCQYCDEPELGWVYSCTEDRDCAVLREDPSLTSTTGFQVQDEDGDVKLNSWVCKAIEKGHYSEAQVQVLLEQRAKVLELIANGNKTPNPEKSDHDASTNDDNDPGSLQSTVNGMNSDSMDDRLNTLVRLLDRGRQKIRNDRLKGACNLQLCPACFSSGLDRAWLSLNGICNTSTQEARPQHISQIPTTQIPIVRRQVESSIKEPIDTDGGVDINDNARFTPRLTPTKESPYSSGQNIPELPNKHHTRQTLGTPRKVSRWDRSIPSSNENNPPGPARPCLRRRREWGKHEEPDPDWSESEDEKGLRQEGSGANVRA